MIIYKNFDTNCIGIPSSIPKKNLCGRVWLNYTPAIMSGTLSDVTCPTCLKVYDWIKSGDCEIEGVPV